jgi:molecular chaperone DnaK (HSP70)
MKFWSFSLWWHAFRGDDFDQLIAEDIITNFKKTEGVDLYQALQRIIEASEKRKLSFQVYNQHALVYRLFILMDKRRNILM